MLGIILDAAVLLCVIKALQGDDAADFMHLVIVALGLGVANFVCALALGGVLGLFVLLPIIIIDGLILMFFCSLPIKHAAITLGIFLVYKVAYQVTWMLIFH